MFSIIRSLVVVGVVSILMAPSSWAKTIVRCTFDLEQSNKVVRSILSSHINFSFDEQVLKNSGKTGVHSFLNFDLDHMSIIEGELYSHFRAHLAAGELEWIRHNEEVFDVRFKVNQAIYQVRFDLKGAWPQDVALLFSYSPYPSYGVQRVASVLCTKSNK